MESGSERLLIRDKNTDWRNVMAESIMVIMSISSVSKCLGSNIGPTSYQTFGHITYPFCISVSRTVKWDNTNNTSSIRSLWRLDELKRSINASHYSLFKTKDDCLISFVVGPVSPALGTLWVFSRCVYSNWESRFLLLLLFNTLFCEKQIPVYWIF